MRSRLSIRLALYRPAAPNCEKANRKRDTMENWVNRKTLILGPATPTRAR